MLAEFTIFPVGEGTSLSKYVARAIDLVEKSGLNHKVGPMGTAVEGSWDQIMGLMKKCHDAVAQDSDRVVMHIYVDDRKGAKDCLTCKIESVEKRLGHPVKK
jgi:uncharacterized protein (TIGR00106 family)